ncbi:response regulator [bacterium (Candidatus Gribaldobacteria) CG10_big_fil_rev_8_21_14_0_10_41_12]|uniref:Response regulator n=1 Tax=bacterium (Candidatus Gribaldobacteria) CG10_big_fil_rev_8_21_14_0_10_41_12 TaxID=2014277 RepID=A0A2H0UW87_9BACT|nr:MAG: response regulator [Parcubacteria group bacterium CG1_02_41_26]PIR91075.1 MAG: response regulator [bacterium (Candidatus Gribaldobacteria) CG10_big_fil_rev_8_21_14_0_10_41_12]
MSKILVIEDDKFLRELMVRKLASEPGFEILSAIDGENGLKSMKEQKPEVVLLDLILPGIGGFDVLAKMKEDMALADIPVIILSNLGQQEDVDKGMQLGAVDFMIKAHFTPNEIVEKIKQVLNKTNN